MRDVCARVFRPNTKSICICRYLASMGTATPEILVRRCGASKSTVSHVLHILEEHGYIKRIYYNDVDYTVVWSTEYARMSAVRKW